MNVTLVGLEPGDVVEVRGVDGGVEVSLGHRVPKPHVIELQIGPEAQRVLESIGAARATVGDVLERVAGASEPAPS